MTPVTPKTYVSAPTGERDRAELGTRSTVVEAICEAGYRASGRSCDQADAWVGTTPTSDHEGCADATVRFALGECSLGSILVAATARGLCAILLGDDPEALTHDLERRFPQAERIGADADLEALVAKVIGLVERPRVAVELPLDIRGTAFQQHVWQVLRAIPAGTTASYAEVARTIGAPKAVRAVAQACAANPLALAIPCHRVVRTDGGLAGYRWGVDRKRALLAREERS